MRVIGVTFAAVFLAELGDKTQLATLGIAAGSKKSISVFVGAGLALILSTALAVLLGSAMGAALPVKWIRLGAALLFLAIGTWTLIEAIKLF
jgi:putative Ca2+/H+ antiporter (TMEM165/GDT1 family)